jgi:OFA family oxalate/formate antiporter-like MFS transporter
MVMIANLQYAWTLFVNPMQETMRWTTAEIGLAFTIFINFQTFVQPIDGWFIDRLGPRKFITAAGILCGVGWGALAFATTLPQLYFFYALAGIGAAFVYSGCIGSALKWFPTRRGLASGLIAAGFGGGTALFIPIIKYLIDTHSYRTAFWATGLIQGVVIAVVAQFLRHPGKDFVAKPAAAAVARGATRKNTESFTTGEMMRTPHFYLMYAIFLAAASGGLVLTAQAGPIAKAWGLTAVLTMSTTVGPLANLASRISWGSISDKLGRELTMAIAFGLQSLCMLSVLTIGKGSGLLFTITVALTFFTWGEVYSLFPSTVGDYFGSRNATSNYGALYTAKGVASILAGYLAALVFDTFKSWDLVFYGAAVLAFMAALGALALRASPLPKKAEVREARVAQAAR